MVLPATSGVASKLPLAVCPYDLPLTPYVALVLLRHPSPPTYTRVVKCAQCGSDNPEGNSYCGTCGQKLYEAFEAVPVQGDEGAFYCYRHRRESTRLSCGRCRKPICTRCAIHGPAGIRCPECAKQHIAIRPMGVVSDFTRGFRNIGRGSPYSIYIWFIVVMLVVGSVRGCMFMREQPERPSHERSAPRDSEE